MDEDFWDDIFEGLLWALPWQLWGIILMVFFITLATVCILTGAWPWQVLATP